ncbi:histidinol-phosphate aminotransferase [Marinobacter segnicrescens]|uniref:Histidinol-phosphate aminotransferase n=1 Tax=Marinobacter segnicrescens TaxID=430453 RepID=A0A1I0AWF5_9GAMM|nr:histidinol-phosphate transaminase [Marinobacter segnicrescens]SES98318.1 histidinol-phosphate aminotransferase [Marinobacter segnicrescens]
MSKFWSSLVSQLKPYVPGEQPKMERLVKLNTNENPYGPSPRVLEAIRAQLDERLRLYPDPESEQLCSVIATCYGVSPEQVFVGNGSDEVLAHIFQGLLKQDRPILFPDITYSFYPVYCGLYGVESQLVPLTGDFEIDPQDYLVPNGGIIFPNPNAPTGRALPLVEVERIVAGNPDSVVVVDEAYVDFGAESAVTLVDRYPNLLVSQTLSKARSLAGLRVGLAIGHRDLVEALNRVKNSFNSYPLDRLAQAGAVAAFEDEAWFNETRQRVMDERARVTLAMTAMGFEVLPSSANFIFARHASQKGADLALRLRERGIIVRHFDKPRIDDFLRITIGTAEQNDELLQALKGLVN